MLVIPSSKKDDKKALEVGLQLVEKLEKKLAKKKRIELFKGDEVLLF
ncbi:hypothetical protein IJU97_00570 [bacterium]|nr:hypothetical protein [bacterium]